MRLRKNHFAYEFYTAFVFLNVDYLQLLKSRAQMIRRSWMYLLFEGVLVRIVLMKFL